MRRLALAGLGAAVAMAAAAAVPPGRSDGPLRVEPARVAIGLFYRGARVTVSADVDSGTAVAVLVTGPAGDLPLRTQARLWGLFWAPAGHVTFEHVPAAYALATSAPLGRLAPPALLRALDIGYDLFRPDSTRPLARDFFPELIRLRESERLFRIQEGGVRLVAAGGGRQRAEAIIVLPARAPAAAYRVRLFGFRAGRLVAREESAFTVSRSGLVAWIGALARDQGLVYGIVAVVVAVGAGLLVGVVFGPARGH